MNNSSDFKGSSNFKKELLCSVFFVQSSNTSDFFTTTCRYHQQSDFELNNKVLVDSDSAMEPGPCVIGTPKEAATGNADFQGGHVFSPVALSQPASGPNIWTKTACPPGGPRGRKKVITGQDASSCTLRSSDQEI